MNRDNFASAIAVVLDQEGGYVVDEGGATKYGISQRAYPHEDIENLTVERAKTLYRRDYWAQCRCDALPWPLALYVFDCAVNQGQGTARRLLQKALDVTMDGNIGPLTIRAASTSTRWHSARFMAIRGLRYAGTHNFDTNGAGWFTRLFEVTQRGEHS